MSSSRPFICLAAWLAAGLLLAAPVAAASPDQIVLQHNGEEILLSVHELREQADVEFAFYDPYLAEEVEIRGLIFRDLLTAHLGGVPETLHFYAWDEYDVALGGWNDDNWILVTHQDGEPLSLRERGPVRLVERDYGDRDPGNLRNFNDWIWMIKRIEAVP